MIKTDKILHFAICFCITGIVALLCYGAFELSKATSILAGFGVSLVIGIAKEAYDYYISKTGFDKQDILADVSGAVLASLFTLGM